MKSVSAASAMAAAMCAGTCCFVTNANGIRTNEESANIHDNAYDQTRLCSSNRARTICGSVVCASCSRLGCTARIVVDYDRRRFSRGVRGEAERGEPAHVRMPARSTLVLRDGDVH